MVTNPMNFIFSSFIFNHVLISNVMSAANYPNQTCRYNLRSCLQQYLATGASVYHGSNCTAMTVQNTVMVAMESTTYHEHVAPGSAPQAGAAPNSVSHLVFICGLCVCTVLIAHRGSSWLRGIL